MIRPPLQKRSQESLERVLQAGLDLLQAAGFEGFTLQEVSRRANVSIGSIYARAASKEELILAIYDREMERIAAEQERIASPHEGLSSRELVETLVREMAEIMLGHAASLRVFMHRSAIDPEIWRRGSERSHVLANVFETSLLEHADELAHPDPELAIDVTYRFVYAALARRITHGPSFESPRETSDEDLVRELATAAANYLLTGPVSSELEH
jgi:AcrR family transcriptional regulator